MQSTLQQLSFGSWIMYSFLFVYPLPFLITILKAKRLIQLVKNLILDSFNSTYLISIFFLKHAGELCIIILRKKVKNTSYTHAYTHEVLKYIHFLSSLSERLLPKLLQIEHGCEAMSNITWNFWEMVMWPCSTETGSEDGEISNTVFSPL